MDTIYPPTSDTQHATNAPAVSTTAITTPAARLASVQLDRITIAQDNGKTSTLQRWTKRALEAAFVPAYGREVSR